MKIPIEIEIPNLFSLNWKIFLMTSAAIFCMVVLQKFEVRPPQLLNNFFQTPLQSTEILKPYLEKKSSGFTLKKYAQNFKPTVQAASPFYNAFSYIVVDFDSGKVLEEKNASKRLSIASLTKIMTAVVTLDLVSPYAYFTISKTASQVEPTSIGVIPGEKMNVKELLHALLLTSANDAAAVIQENINRLYKQNIFLTAMNQKAKILKLQNTHFSNAQGFDSPSNYSTAEDLAVLSHYALTQYPLIAAIAQKEYQFLPADTYHKQFDLYNWNGLIGVYPNILGLKIGNTEHAQKTAAVISQRNNKKILVILLGAPGVLERDLWVSQLLDLGFQKAQNLLPIQVSELQLQSKYSTWKYWN